MAYDKYTWVSGEVIEAELLNHIEDGIADIAVITDQMNFTSSTAGPTANVNLTWGGTFAVPQVARNNLGLISTLNNRTMTMPAAPTASVTPPHYTNTTISQIGITLNTTVTIEQICAAMPNESYATIRVSTSMTALLAQLITSTTSILTIYKSSAGESMVRNQILSATVSYVRDWIAFVPASATIGSLTQWRLDTNNVYTGADTIAKGLSNTTSTIAEIGAVMQNGDVAYIPVVATSVMNNDMPMVGSNYILEIVKISTNYAMCRATRYSSTLSYNEQWTCYYDIRLAAGENQWNETGPNKNFFFGWGDFGMTTAEANTATLETIIRRAYPGNVIYLVTYSSQSPVLLAQMPFPSSGTYLLEIAVLSSTSITIRTTRVGNTQSAMEQWTCYLTSASQAPTWTPTGGLISINSSTLSLNTFTTPGRYRWDATNTTISNKPESGSPALLEVEFIGANSQGASVYRQTCHVGDVSTSSGSYTIYVRMITRTTAGSVSSGQWRSITGTLG